jgi:hypothetical protein
MTPKVNSPAHAVAMRYFTAVGLDEFMADIKVRRERLR